MLSHQKIVSNHTREMGDLGHFKWCNARSGRDTGSQSKSIDSSQEVLTCNHLEILCMHLQGLTPLTRLKLDKGGNLKGIHTRMGVRAGWLQCYRVLPSGDSFIELLWI